MIKCKVLATCFVGLAIQFSAYAATWTITYPKPLDDSDARAQYPIALLKLALGKTGVNYELRPSDRILLPGKAMRQLRENREVNVVWSMTDSQREKEVAPIRIPIAKGLIGMRVFVVNNAKRQKFESLESLADMRKLVPIQGEEWPDTKILQANGFNVFTVPEFREAYDLIKQGKADFFPRSVMEVSVEMAEEGRSSNLFIEPSMALYYPTAMYYFVNSNNVTLANLIETGLQRALEDGSFDALFYTTYAPIIAELDMNGRNVFTLENPLLPAETPLNDARLWYKTESVVAQ
ncbi:MAG: amino acid ABC transporter substrate-binding protein [Pseudomonadota bacterium]|nr:amino acid ABC transporter substrate-binding protein [Pseudomonadota bacterium]